MKKALFVFVSILVASLIRAADKPAPPAKKPEAAVAENAPAPAPAMIELKNKSSFKIGNESRNPFWPMGFKPSGKLSNSSASESATGDVSANVFAVTTITLDSRGRFAIINGKTMVEGQQFGLQMGSQTYQITVKAIEDGRVILARRNQEIIVPLRRK